MAGRKPMGPKLVHHLDGSGRAKERLEVILETVSGKLTISEACERLGIEEAMFYRLRMQALEAALSRLEPRPAGRPPRTDSPESERIAELERTLEDKELELKAADVRAEVAQAMPHVVRDEGLKKTTQRKHRRKLVHKDRRRRGKKSR
jgi:transposase-like protein